MEKLLITGVSGLLGSNLAKIASGTFEVYGIYNQHPVKIKNCKTFKLDLSDKGNLKKMMKGTDPDFIIHCAALTRVDYCEDNEEAAKLLNVECTRNLAGLSEDRRMIYISTDSVFDGKTGMYTENNRPNPLNVYARTKLEGERVIEAICPDHVIVRTNIYGWNIENKLSYGEWILNSLKANKKTNIFSDVYFTPIIVNNLSETLLSLYKKDFRGVINVAGSERCSKLFFAEKLAEVFKLNKKLINPVRVEEMDLKAARPLDTSLDVSKAKKELDTELLDVENGLRLMKKLMDDGYVNELKSGFI